MILNDRQITELCESHAMIFPHVFGLQRSRFGLNVISYGQSSFGYDIQLSDSEFYTFHRRPGVVVDPKNFSSNDLTQVELVSDTNGEYFILPAHSYGLGVSVERFNLPDHVIGICVGKSTYARCGIYINVTPLEPGWNGFLTIEIANSSDADCRVYANEGIAQIVFLSGEAPLVSYANRKGKYQGQSNNVELARV